MLMKEFNPRNFVDKWFIPGEMERDSEETNSSRRTQDSEFR